MKTIDIHPEYMNFTDEELIESIPTNYILPLTGKIASFYDGKLSMKDVYSIYGQDLGDTESQQQVQCLLPSHGSQDRHASARFYPVDRHTGEVKHAVYCHKCQKTVTPFWLVYFRESYFSEIHMRGVYAFLKKTFQVPFPRHVYLDFDPQAYFVFEETEVQNKIQKIKQAETILRLKEARDPLYLSEIKRFWEEI